MLPPPNTASPLPPAPYTTSSSAHPSNSSIPSPASSSVSVPTPIPFVLDPNFPDNKTVLPLSLASLSCCDELFKSAMVKKHKTREGLSEIITIDYSKIAGETPFKLYVGQALEVSGCFIPQGVGAMVYRDDSLYQGTWRRGLRDGIGIMTYGPKTYQDAWFHCNGCPQWVGEVGGYYSATGGEQLRAMMPAHLQEASGEQIFALQPAIYIGAWKDDRPDDRIAAEYFGSTQEGAKVSQDVTTIATQ